MVFCVLWGRVFASSWFGCRWLGCPWLSGGLGWWLAGGLGSSLRRLGIGRLTKVLEFNRLRSIFDLVRTVLDGNVPCPPFEGHKHHDCQGHKKAPQKWESNLQNHVFIALHGGGKGRYLGTGSCILNRAVWDRNNPIPASPVRAGDVFHVVELNNIFTENCCPSLEHLPGM